MLEAIEVYRSARRAACAERAFMLDAIGIDSEIWAEGPVFVLAVESAEAARACEQLAIYERERRPPPPSPPPAPVHAHAWLGCALYAIVLIVMAWLAANGVPQPDTFAAGALDAGRVQAGQWWRAWTALTLHLDGAHLLANLAAGIWFGYLADRQLGSGHAWFLVLTGGACANLLEALIGPASHRAVGASTAVFTALGVVCAYTWGTRARWARHWALQWAPLVGGVVLLGWLGSGGGDASGQTGQVDIVAHVLGFTAGLLLGAAVARPRLQRLLPRVPQWATGAAALAELAIAWRCALSR